MKFSLFTSYDNPYKPVADLTMPVLQEYCGKWGHELMIRQNPTYPRGIYWGRIDDMMAYTGEADWLIHVDADVLITNLNVSLVMLLRIALSPDPTGASIIVGSDHNGINDGMLFINNWNRRAAQHVMASSLDCFQTALAEDMKTDKYIKSCVRAPVQRLFNSYAPGEYPEQDVSGQWQEGDFALHLPGRTNERRVELITNHLHLIQR